MKQKDNIVIKVGFTTNGKLNVEKVYSLRWPNRSTLPNANNFLEEFERWVESDPECVKSIVR